MPPIEHTRGNTSYVGICFLGDFSGPSYKGSQKPSEAQLETGRKLWAWLNKRLGLAPWALFGHYHFGKRNCPGTHLERLIEELRVEDVKDLVPSTIVQWQQALVDLGYDLGEFGPNDDGVDGDWGRVSKRALVEFQRNSPVHNTGQKDAMTAAAIAWDLKDFVEDDDQG